MPLTRLNRSMPQSDVIPVLVYADVHAAVAWLCTAFGLRERLRIGGHRVQLAFGGGHLVVAHGAAPAAIDDAALATHSIMLRVADVDGHHARAVAAGARVGGPPTDYPYGERQYSAVDPWGHRWTFSQSVADSDPATWGGELVGA